MTPLDQIPGGKIRVDYKPYEDELRTFMASGSPFCRLETHVGISLACEKDRYKKAARNLHIGGYHRNVDFHLRGGKLYAERIKK